MQYASAVHVTARESSRQSSGYLAAAKPFARLFTTGLTFERPASPTRTRASTFGYFFISSRISGTAASSSRCTQKSSSNFGYVSLNVDS